MIGAHGGGFPFAAQKKMKALCENKEQTINVERKSPCADYFFKIHLKFGAPCGNITVREYSSVAELKLPKLAMRVRFPLFAPQSSAGN